MFHIALVVWPEAVPKKASVGARSTLFVVDGKRNDTRVEQNHIGELCLGQQTLMSN
jgi:hypothetical protein